MLFFGTRDDEFRKPNVASYFRGTHEGIRWTREKVESLSHIGIPAKVFEQVTCRALGTGNSCPPLGWWSGSRLMKLADRDDLKERAKNVTKSNHHKWQG